MNGSTCTFGGSKPSNDGSPSDFEGCFEADDDRLGIFDAVDRREAGEVLHALDEYAAARAQQAGVLGQQDQ